MRITRLTQSIAALPARRTAVLGATAAVCTNAVLALIHNTLGTSNVFMGRVFTYLFLGMSVAVIAGAFRALEDDWFLPGVLLAGFALATEANLMFIHPQLWGSLGSLAAVALDAVGIACVVLVCYLRLNRRRQTAVIHQFPAQSSVSRRHAA